MPMRNRVEIKSYVRFQLAQLSAKNAEHEFERLTFELARLRISPNLLPATGPVQAGGDQGCDFESYRTYLAHSPIGNSAFLAPDRLIVGACTLNKKIERKMKSDLGTIFGHGQRPSHVAYFCEPDLAVAKRHALQEYCQNEHNASLDIFDGQAIADMLSDRDSLWIAEQFLDLPADAWPTPSALDEQYTSLRERWLFRGEIPHNYADFLDIKEGLRTATGEAHAKPDLDRWIDAMRLFLAEVVPSRLKQKARYEIAVAELKGRASLDPALPLIQAFFDTVSPDRPPGELLDAAVLTVYVWAAQEIGQASVAAKTIYHWLQKVDDVLEKAFHDYLSQGERCTLLEAQAMVAYIPRPNRPTPSDVLLYFFSAWEKVVREVEKTPLFPVTHIADILEVASSVVGPDKRLTTLTDKVDALIANRAGKGAAAERARRRAIAHFDAGRYVAAINELQKTKEAERK
jgi:hypothetical protein